MRISLCMIAKNEELLLSSCLESVKGFVDEIIVVDTGSVDGTKEVALSYGARVVDYNWNDDFAAARNESLNYATGDWILVLDADEMLDDKGKQLLLETIQLNDAIYGFYLSQVHYTNIFTSHPDFIALEREDFKGCFFTSVLRFFRNDQRIRFEYCVHEMVDDTLGRCSMRVETLPVFLHHYQELKGNFNLNAKQDYYFKLTLKTIEQYPLRAKAYNDAAVYYNTVSKDIDNAIEFCTKAVELEPKNINYVLHLSYLLRDAGRLAEAVEGLERFISTKISTNSGEDDENADAKGDIKSDIKGEVKDDERVYRALGYLFYLQHNYIRSEQCYLKLLEFGTVRLAETQQMLTTLREILNGQDISNQENQEKLL